MMKFFLRARHWQLFLLVAVCSAWPPNDIFGRIINLIGLIGALGWIHSVGIKSQEKIAALGLAPMPANKLKLSGLVFVLAIACAEGWTVAGLNPDPAVMTEGEATGFFVLAAASTFSFLYQVVFAAKAFAKVRLEREVFFQDYLGNVLLILFFALGIWWLQPKINVALGDEPAEL